MATPLRTAVSDFSRSSATKRPSPTSTSRRPGHRRSASSPTWAAFHRSLWISFTAGRRDGHSRRGVWRPAGKARATSTARPKRGSISGHLSVPRLSRGTRGEDLGRLPGHVRRCPSAGKDIRSPRSRCADTHAGEERSSRLEGHSTESSRSNTWPASPRSRIGG